jgi:DUF1009 family protein
MSDAAVDPMAESSPLAIICGAGSLPFAVADAVRKRGRSAVFFAIRGWADPQRILDYPHHSIGSPASPVVRAVGTWF